MIQSATLPHDRSAAQRIVILLLAILQILVTLLPAAGAGEAIGERSDAARTLITPAGWTFSIWGPLYAGSLAYAVYQLLPAQKRSALVGQVGWASAGAFLGNALWALYTQFASLNFVSALIIIFTLYCLMVTYRRFATWSEPLSRGERFLVILPLSALASWLTAATIVNIAAVLDYHGLDVGSTAPLVATAIVIIGAIIASLAISRGRGNPWYALVFLWALAGIYGANQSSNDEILIAVVLAALMAPATTLLTLRHPANRDRWFTGNMSHGTGRRSNETARAI